MILDGLVFLGGRDYGSVLRPGTVVDLRMTTDAVVLTDVGDGSRAHTFPVSELRELEAIDPATVMNDGLAPSAGGSSGGLRDQATAVWMTESAGKSSIMALVRIVTEKGELLLRSMTAAPDAAHIALSPLRRRLTRHAIVPATPGRVTGPLAGPDAGRRVGPDAKGHAGQDAAAGPGGRVGPDAGRVGPDAGRRAMGGGRSSGPQAPAGASARDVSAADDTDADADTDFVSRLERLARLRDAGALSEYEFLLAKTKLLS